MKIHNNKIAIHFTTLVVTILLLLTAVTTLAVADNDSSYDQIIQTYSFSKPQIIEKMIDNTIYHQVVIPGSPGAWNPGEPNLPAYGVNILIPQGREVTDVEVKPGNRVFLGSGFNVELVEEPVKLSDIDSFSSLAQVESVYGSDRLFPEMLHDVVGVYGFRGYEILSLMLYPVQYISTSGELVYYEDLTVVVRTVETDEINPLYRDMESDEVEVIKKVDNPFVVDSYRGEPSSPVSSGGYDLLIITIDDFKSHFTPLKDVHKAEGVNTEIKTFEDISIFPDRVTTRDIRDFIRDEYLNNGIEYVLIGGDDDVVPAKGLWVQAVGDTTVMPSDLYYACLDGTYNYDDDDYSGEPTDGNDGGDVDLVAEVYVGRACVGSTTEVDNFVDKTIAYIESGGYSSGEVLMVGEYLWNDPDTWGGDYMDELINGSNASMYSTVGIPFDRYTVDKLYDRDWPGNDWPKSEVKSRLNNGVRIINHLGHSSYDYNMKMFNNDVSSLNNNDLFFIYSQGCMAGGFDDDDCIAEYHTVKTDNAAFAVIMNARYGWGVAGGTNGPSQRFHREFWDAIFGEEINEIGKANQDSKEDIIPRINGPCMRWCYYQLNLFGDPTLAFCNSENNPPFKPSKPSGVKLGRVGEEYELTSKASDEDGDKLCYKWDFGDGTFSEWLGPFDSGEEVTVTYSWSKIGRYQVKVKARDEHRDESDWSDPLPITMPIYNKFPLLNLLFEFLEKYFPQIFSLFDKV